MANSDSKHDKILNRVHLWVAVLGGILTILIGVYNFKGMLFASKQPVQAAVETPAKDAQKTATVSPPTSNIDIKIRQYDWKGAPADFSLLDLDGNGILNAQDLKGTSFESMDRNGDGSIERLEWRKSRRAFDLLDADNSGKVNRGEFAAHERAADALNINSKKR